MEIASSRLWGTLASVAPPVPSFISYLFGLWYKLVYYFYFTLPLAMMAFVWSLTITFLYFWSRNSPLVKKFLIHASAIVDVLVNIGNVLANTSISVLAVDGIKLLMDVLTSFLDWRVSEVNSQAIDVPSMTFAELNDLLYYEELSDEEGDNDLYERLGGKHVIGFGRGGPGATGLGLLGVGRQHVASAGPSKQNMRRKMKQHMHQYIPPHTFRATIRVKTDTTSTSADTSAVQSESSSAVSSAVSFSGTESRRPTSPLLCPSEDEEEMVRDARPKRSSTRATQRAGRRVAEPYTPAGASVNVSGSTSGDAASVQDIVSPMSFPATPYSRAQVMNKNAERVISTIFSARDILRMELLSTSGDETSRRAALEAKNEKKIAVFDPKQTSEGLSLTCGNHCLMKVGKGLCYSSRSMLSLRRDMYIYYEFSVTASHKQVPVLSIGLSPAFAPLGTMVGSSELSFGVRSDGRLLVRSIWHSPSVLHPFSPGSTVGFLVYMGASPFGKGATASGSANAGVDTHTLSATATATARAGTVSPERGLERADSNSQDGGQEEDGGKLCASIAINVDGNLLQLDQRANAALESVLLESLDGQVDLFPTVSLLSPQVRVWCRFCEADILQRNPVAVGTSKQTDDLSGASNNIYCLDGSRIR
tara:strand:+ start:625 stop:2568 length:1944 start_codon:yes stop_codon:yes gene_type:complete